MISQKCPRCVSNRIRCGYRPTPIWSKIFFRYYLLCDNCNWEFTGFAVPGTVSAKPTRKHKKTQHIEEEKAVAVIETPVPEDLPPAHKIKQKVRKNRVKVKL